MTACGHDTMSARELEQAQLVQSERRMSIVIAAKQRQALKARIMINEHEAIRDNKENETI
jgi:hypothetical protein